MTKLTKTQATILKAAARRPDGNIEPLPTNLRGGARTKVIKALFEKGLIWPKEPGYCLRAKGYEAIGLKPPKKPSGLREGTKQALLLELLRRPKGTTIAELCKASGWQQHTVRGFFANTLKKRLGLKLIAIKEAGQPSRYQVAS